MSSSSWNKCIHPKKDELLSPKINCQWITFFLPCSCLVSTQPIFSVFWLLNNETLLWPVIPLSLFLLFACVYHMIFFLWWSIVQKYFCLCHNNWQTKPNQTKKDKKSRLKKHLSFRFLSLVLVWKIILEKIREIPAEAHFWSAAEETSRSVDYDIFC